MLLEINAAQAVSRLSIYEYISHISQKSDKKKEVIVTAVSKSHLAEDLIVC